VRPILIAIRCGARVSALASHAAVPLFAMVACAVLRGLVNLAATIAAAAITALMISGSASALDFSGYIAADLRAFTQAAADPAQRSHPLSVSLAPQLHHSWPTADTRYWLHPFCAFISQTLNAHILTFARPCTGVRRTVGKCVLAWARCFGA
jgi:hypothetical protein